MVTEQKKCEHPACNCMISDEENYCSPYCDDAADTTEIACNCGHAGCGVGKDVRRTMTGSPS